MREQRTPRRVKAYFKRNIALPDGCEVRLRHWKLVRRWNRRWVQRILAEKRARND